MKRLPMESRINLQICAIELLDEYECTTREEITDLSNEILVCIYEGIQDYCDSLDIGLNIRNLDIWEH